MLQVPPEQVQSMLARIRVLQVHDIHDVMTALDAVTVQLQVPQLLPPFPVLHPGCCSKHSQGTITVLHCIQSGMRMLNASSTPAALQASAECLNQE